MPIGNREIRDESGGTLLNVIRKFWSGLSAPLRQSAPPSRTFHLHGQTPQGGSIPKFDQILIVDDVPRYAQTALDALRQFYQNADLTVHITHTFAEALATFQQNDIKLVILDLDLDDFQGDGAVLLAGFRARKPEITVLANSSKQRYNEILLKGGATAALCKDVRKLRRWLADNG